jgi:hypothetical protein
MSTCKSYGLGAKKERKILMVYSQWEFWGAIKKCQYDGSGGFYIPLEPFFRLPNRSF